MTLQKFQINQEWKPVKLGDVVRNVQINEYEPENVGLTRYVAGEHIESENLFVTKYGEISKAREIIGSAFIRRFSKGQILYVTRRAYLRKAAIATFDGICSNTTLVLETNGQGLISRVLPFLLQSEKFVNYTIQNSVGSTNPYVRWRDLAGFKFMLPPIEIQNKIADILWAVENDLTNSSHLLQKITQLQKVLLNQLLSRGIGHTKFKKIKSLFGKYEQIPEKWEVKTFNDLFEFLRTGTNSREDLGVTGDVHYVHYGDIHAKWNSLLDCDLEEIPRIDEFKVQGLPLLKDGDLIVVDASEDYKGSGTSILLKNVKNRKIVSGLHTIALRNIDQTIISDFRKYLTSIKFVKNQIVAYVTGISVYGLSKNNLKKITIPLPPIEEQQKIVRILDPIGDEISKLDRHIEKLKQLRKNLSSNLLYREYSKENEIVH